MFNILLPISCFIDIPELFTDAPHCFCCHPMTHMLSSLAGIKYSLSFAWLNIKNESEHEENSSFYHVVLKSLLACAVSTSGANGRRLCRPVSAEGR